MTTLKKESDTMTKIKKMEVTAAATPSTSKGFNPEAVGRLINEAIGYDNQAYTSTLRAAKLVYENAGKIGDYHVRLLLEGTTEKVTEVLTYAIETLKLKCRDKKTDPKGHKADRASIGERLKKLAAIVLVLESTKRKNNLEPVMEESGQLVVHMATIDPEAPASRGYHPTGIGQPVTVKALIQKGNALAKKPAKTSAGRTKAKQTVITAASGADELTEALSGGQIARAINARFNREGKAVGPHEHGCTENELRSLFYACQFFVNNYPLGAAGTDTRGIMKQVINF